ncbi:hypothetical protein Y032_0263g611 [Ancylostoma ceylanicum]|uniref:Uncharacterized protein n=1 Tax=Ancylostoma ceylanicum TaxID=53326 RepID=A0A016SAZ1_9BILA|nr:hypothetical protein Y032_0263g611 [Ancylostoma ceylanicum]
MNGEGSGTIGTDIHHQTSIQIKSMLVGCELQVNSWGSVQKSTKKPPIRVWRETLRRNSGRTTPCENMAARFDNLDEWLKITLSFTWV